MLETLVVFRVGELRLGIDIRRVREVARAISLSAPLPSCSGVAGMITLRGEAAAVIDLNILLGAPSEQRDRHARMIAVRHDGATVCLLWSKVKSTGGRAFVDFEPYAPSNDEPAAFLGVPLRDDSGAMTGVLAIQIPLDRINAVMQAREGLGETGSTYLVGPDKLMRSDSFVDPQNHSVAASFRNPSSGSVDTEAANAALGGESSAKITTDFRDAAVLTAYTPVDVCGTRWALLAEKDQDGALLAVQRVRQAHDSAEVRLVGAGQSEFSAGPGFGAGLPTPPEHRTEGLPATGRPAVKPSGSVARPATAVARPATAAAVESSGSVARPATAGDSPNSGSGSGSDMVRLRVDMLESLGNLTGEPRHRRPDGHRSRRASLPR